MQYFKTLIKALFGKVKPESPQYFMNSAVSVWGNTQGSISFTESDNEGYSAGQISSVKKQKIAIKPIDVFHELERVPTAWTMEGLDEKIAITKEKINFSRNTTVKAELEYFLTCLENRKMYNKPDKNKQLYSSFFKQFDTTTSEKISDLTSKYDLMMGDVDLFIPELPAEAIKIMKEFTDKTVAMCNKKPNFKIIAETKDFRDVQRKRDPILLVQSPFGLYFYILGAWDKEMQLLSEL